MMTGRKGFTIIEILIVIVIVAILAAVAMPLFSGMVWKARLGEVLTVVDTIVNAERIYYGQNKAYTCVATDQCLAGNGSPTGSTDVQKLLGISISSNSYFTYLVYPSTTFPTAYNVYFKQPGYDWAWYYAYAPSDSTDWHPYGGTDSEAKRYFTPPPKPF